MKRLIASDFTQNKLTEILNEGYKDFIKDFIEKNLNQFSTIKKYCLENEEIIKLFKEFVKKFIYEEMQTNEKFNTEEVTEIQNFNKNIINKFSINDYLELLHFDIDKTISDLKSDFISATNFSTTQKYIAPTTNKIIDTAKEMGVENEDYDAIINHSKKQLEKAKIMALKDNLFIRGYLFKYCQLTKCDTERLNTLIDKLEPIYKDIINKHFIKQEQEMLNIISTSLFTNDDIYFDNAKIGDTFIVDGNFYEDVDNRRCAFAIIDDYYLEGDYDTHSDLIEKYEEYTDKELTYKEKNTFGYIVEYEDNFYAIINLSRTQDYTAEEIIKIVKAESDYNFNGFFVANEDCDIRTSLTRLAKRY